MGPQRRRPISGISLAVATVVCLAVSVVIWHQSWRRRPAVVLADIARAQTAAQGGGFNDVDTDSVGEFLHLAQLCGEQYTTHVDAHQLTLIEHDLGSDVDVESLPRDAACPTRTAIAGYLYASYLPHEWFVRDRPRPARRDGSRSLSREEADLCNAAERQFVVVAWPASPRRGGNSCWFLDERMRPRPISVDAVTGPDDVVRAAYGSFERLWSRPP